MDIATILLILAAVGNIGMGLFVYLHNRKSLMNFVFSFLAYVLASWGILMIIFRSFESDLLIWTKLLYASAALAVFVLLIFSFLFPDETKKPHLLTGFFIVLGTAAILYITLGTALIITDVQYNPVGENIISFGIGYFLYFFYVMTYVSASMANMVLKLKNASGIQRTQIKYFFVGIIITATVALVFNLTLPTLGVFQYHWYGQVSTFFMLGFMAYAIVKLHFLDIRIIATESLVALLSIILLTNALVSKSLDEFIIKIILFVAVSSISYLLVKSVLKEVRAREEIQKLALQLEKANLELRQLDKTKSEFISIASHQLRTPLTVIKGYISMIQEGTFGSVPAEVTDALKKVYTSNERLIHLVNDLLDISRIERGKMEYEMKPQSAVALIDGAVEELMPRAKEAGLALELKLPPGGLPQITADGEKLHQVFVNIIDNAIKYTERGGVIVSAEPQGKNIVFKFQDTGMGLTEEDLSHLFQRFVRGHRTSRLHANGTGLGLYVAKKIIDAHRGRVWAESEGKGKGSAFYVSLPAASGKTPKRG